MSFIPDIEILQKFVANQLHETSKNENSFCTIQFARNMRGIDKEDFCNQVGLDVKEYELFEKDPMNFPDKEKLPRLILDVSRLLGLSYQFLAGHTPYVYNQRSEYITQEEYDRMLIPKELVAERIRNVLIEDDLEKDAKSLHLICATKELFRIKSIAKELNCTWQYLAGLSFNRWTDDVAACYISSEQLQYDLIMRHIRFIHQSTQSFQHRYEYLMSERLRELRESKKSSEYTQQKMALALNISRQYYARLENGAVAFWSDCEKLQQLSELLNCTPQYLLLMTKEEFGTALYDDHFSELIECMYFPIFGKKTYELPQIKPIEQTLSTLFQDILKTDEQKQLMIIKVIEETLSDKKPMEIIRNIMDDIMPIEKK